MNAYSLANSASFLSKYTGLPSSTFLAMGPLDINSEDFKQDKGKVDLSDYTDLFDSSKKDKKVKKGVLEEIIQDILDKKKDDDDGIDYDKMTKYTEDTLQKTSEIAQEARKREFFREGIRSLANAPLIGAQANLQAAKNIADLTALNMGAMAAQNRVLETNPTKQKIAGKYFR